jgi:hypothetical protein
MMIGFIDAFFYNLCAIANLLTSEIIGTRFILVLVLVLRCTLLYIFGIRLSYISSARTPRKILLFCS